MYIAFLRVHARMHVSVCSQWYLPHCPAVLVEPIQSQREEGLPSGSPGDSYSPSETTLPTNTMNTNTVEYHRQVGALFFVHYFKRIQALSNVSTYACSVCSTLLVAAMSSTTTPDWKAFFTVALVAAYNILSLTCAHTHTHTHTEI